jgi:hypothetical protein
MAAAAAAAVAQVPVVKPHRNFFPFLITKSFIDFSFDNAEERILSHFSVTHINADNI